MPIAFPRDAYRNGGAVFLVGAAGTGKSSCALLLALEALRDPEQTVIFVDPHGDHARALLGLVPPFLGPIIYLFFRPPEYLEDVRERELEIRAIEERLAHGNLQCPVCRARVESTYLVCPVCTTRLKQACESCDAPLEAIWQVCPYCATPVPPAGLGDDETLQPLRARARKRPSA